MALQLGDAAPDFEAETTEGRIKFMTDRRRWAVLFSHPKTSRRSARRSSATWRTPSPTSTRATRRSSACRSTRLENHDEWAKDIADTQGTAPNYPIITDSDFKVSKLYGMLPHETSGDAPPARRPTTRPFATCS